KTSAELAQRKGSFDGFQENREDALGVLEKQVKAVDGQLRPEAEAALKLAEKSGLRNAQLTLIAHTGTIGLFMDCDTLGIEPDFSLIKIKHLVGGQTLRIVNQSVKPALLRLGYSDAQAADVERHLLKAGSLSGAPHLQAKHRPVFDTAMPAPDEPGRMISWN